MDNEVHFSDQALQSLQISLIEWWLRHGRQFPWRETNNVFHILMSEVLLQRTRANQVVSAYFAMISRYPSPADLAAADKETLAQQLYSLGLPQRVDTILKMGQQISQEFDGKVPNTYNDLRKLEGVGDYIARAVCCFGFNQSVIIVDTNTVRIIGRVFGLATHAESRRKKHIRDIHEFLLDRNNSRLYNYALLDLGALICTPKHPKCDLCPLNDYCKYAKSQGLLIGVH